MHFRINRNILLRVQLQVSYVFLINLFPVPGGGSVAVMFIDNFFRFEILRNDSDIRNGLTVRCKYLKAINW